MATNTPNNNDEHYTAKIGNDKDFWLWDSRTGFDLTRHSSTSNEPSPRVTISTSTSPITISPALTALVIIDMQNYFLHPALGRTRGPGHEALDQLVRYAIPAARKAGIRVVWVNWGLSEDDVAEMPPSVVRAFRFEGVGHDGGVVTVDKHGNVGDVIDGKQKYRGVGSDMGKVTDPGSGKEIEVGRLLMKGQWNTALMEPLATMCDEGIGLEENPDMWFHKNRLSGAWEQNDLLDFLEFDGLRTLLFAGVNTDQCVGGTLQDCFSKGYDCVLLNDGCGTTSPNHAQQTWEFNSANTYGFQTSCKAFADGVDAMK